MGGGVCVGGVAWIEGCVSVEVWGVAWVHGGVCVWGGG